MGMFDGFGSGGYGGGGYGGYGQMGMGMAGAAAAPLSMGLSLIPSAAGLIGGLLQRQKAVQLAATNQRPTQTVSSEAYDNQALAQRAAQTGMPSQQYNNQLNQINQNQAVGLGALQGRGGAVGGIGALTARSDQAGQALNAQDATMRMQNLKGLMQANNVIGQQKQAAFDYNQKQQYADRAAAARNFMGSGTQNIFNSAQDLGKLGMLGQMGYFPKGNPSNPNSPSNSYNPDVSMMQSYQGAGLSPMQLSF